MTLHCLSHEELETLKSRWHADEPVMDELSMNEFANWLKRKCGVEEIRVVLSNIFVGFSSDQELVEFKLKWL